MRGSSGRKRLTRFSKNTASRTPEQVSYQQFRTGLTYHDVYHLIYGRKWKRRHGVLGYWRELKQRMYIEYLVESHKVVPEEAVSRALEMGAR